MSFLKNLFGKNEQPSKEELVDAAVCPNCWGKQEYDNQYRKFVEDQTKANINHDKQHQKAFIQQFAETNITGIRLKKDGDQQVCPKCSARF